MKTTKKLLSVFLSVLMVAMTCVSFGSLAFAEDAAVFASGECGDQGGNLTWTLSTDGVLTISGTGAMANYPDSAVAPWATNQLIDMDALTLQFLASKGYSFNSMQEAEAYIEAHPEVIDESIGFEMQLYYMETVNNLPTVRSLIIEEGVTSIARVFYLGLDSVSLPASLSAVPDGALLVDGTLTVHGIGTDVSNVCFRACQDGYAFATKAQRDDYETVQNQYYAAAVNLSHYMTPFTDEQVQAYMEAHEGMTEADARAEMQRNAENNARMLGVAFGVPGSSAADILHKAFLGIDGILGTSYADDAALATSWNADTASVWYQNSFKPTLMTKFFGSADPQNVNVQEGNLKLSDIGGDHFCLPWAVIEARCDSLARSQSEGKGAKLVSLGGHVIENHEAKAPTCGAVGWDAYQTCAKCDYTTYAEKPATGVHTWGEWTVTTPATATADGVKTRECGVCHETETDVIPATDAPSNPDTPDTPDNPGQSDSGKCVCGETHTGFFGKLLTFFHKIIYFFKNLFNR